jgi:hypothetical protein
MRGGTLLALIQEKPTSIAGHGAEGERGQGSLGSRMSSLLQLS